MANQTNKGFKRLINAAGYSLQGFRSAYHHEEAFRQEVWLSLCLIPLGLWLGQSALERLALVVPLFIVLLAELLNSAIEAVVDRVGTEYHELSGRAKDIGSAAVFVSLSLTVLSWSLVLWDRL